MANHHLRNKALSLKAKGLLSLMLALPEDWDYTTRGLSCICKDGVDSIRVGIQELEANGYLVRERHRNENGQYGAIEYTILEKPRQVAIPPPVQEKPILENPTQAIPMQDFPTQEIPAQLNIEESNTQKSNTDESNTHSFFPSDAQNEGQTEIRDVRERIKHQIEYDWLRGQFRQEQVDELRQQLGVIDYAAAARYERELRHDVMAHIRAWGEHCPKARGIIHLGATSCYVDDNGDLIAFRDAMEQVRGLLLGVIGALADFALAQKDTPVLAYTHYQAAQPTTLGKRACMWLQDFMFDLERLDFELERLEFYGCKGATGTGASFLALFGGDAEKADELERRIAADMGFTRV